MKTVTEKENLNSYTESELKARGEAVKAKSWQALANAIEPEYSAAIVRELGELYSLFDNRIVTWLAKLYDPKIGGWYHTNSARDTEGFLPDIESTYAALRYLSISGMCEAVGGAWEEAIPEWLKKKVVDFIYPLQDEDGYFYQPQWPKEYITEKKCYSKISRDKAWARSIFGKLGVDSKYGFDVPISASSGALTKRFESAEAFREHLESELSDGIERFSKRFEDPRARTFYGLGNSLQSNSAILNAHPELLEVYKDFFGSAQNKETGAWGDTVCYNATNAAHKIVSTYNMLGLRLEYVDELLDTTFRVLSLSSDECPASGAVDIYNAWSVFPYIYDNISRFGVGTEKEREAKRIEIKRRVLEFAPKGIAISREQISHFKRDDGSFSYHRTENSTGIQGCPAAVPHLWEGDVNGNTICTIALKQHIFAALELSEYEPPIFTEYDRRIFMGILEDLNATAK